LLVLGPTISPWKGMQEVGQGCPPSSWGSIETIFLQD